MNGSLWTPAHSEPCHLPAGHPSGSPLPQAAHPRPAPQCSHLARVGLAAPVDLTEAPSPDDAVDAEVVHGQLRGRQRWGRCGPPGPPEPPCPGPPSPHASLPWTVPSCPPGVERWPPPPGLAPGGRSGQQGSPGPPRTLTWMLSSTFFHWQNRVNLSLQEKNSGSDTPWGLSGMVLGASCLIPLLLPGVPSLSVHFRGCPGRVPAGAAPAPTLALLSASGLLLESDKLRGEVLQSAPDFLLPCPQQCWPHPCLHTSSDTALTPREALTPWPGSWDTKKAAPYMERKSAHNSHPPGWLWPRRPQWAEGGQCVLLCPSLGQMGLAGGQTDPGRGEAWVVPRAV